MRLNISDLAAYIASDLRLHILTCVGVFVLGVILIYLVVRLSKSRRILAGTEQALDTAVRHTERQAAEIQSWRRFFGPFPSLYENSPEIEPGWDHNSNTIAIDLDGVILEYVDPWNGVAHFGKPIPGAAAAIGKLKSLGFKIVIYTTRNNSMACHNKGYNTLELTALVQAKLEDAKIPYDFIALFKPLASYYIDDRAIRFKNWGQTLEDVRKAEFNRSVLKIEKMNDSLCYQTPSCDPSDPRHG